MLRLLIKTEGIYLADKNRLLKRRKINRNNQNALGHVMMASTSDWLMTKLGNADRLLQSFLC